MNRVVSLPYLVISKSAIRSRVVLALLVLCTLAATVAPSWSQQVPEKILFENNTLLPGWKAETTEGASHEVVPGGIRFVIDAWKEGKDMWPRLWLLGPGIDLSHYTRMLVEIENPTDNDQTIVLGAKAVQEDNAGQVSLVPAHSTQEIMLDISDGAMLDQSNVTQILLYMYQPAAVNTYILKKVRVVANPDFVSARAALGSQLEETRRSFDDLKRVNLRDADALKPMQETQALLAATERNYQQAAPGYTVGVKKDLLAVQQTVARLGIDRRKVDLWVWGSPLGLPIRKGTLPSSRDEALQQIKDRLCLNQYKAICVNFSAAAKPQTVQVKLHEPANAPRLLALRPTLFVKARDTSETADAIGEATGGLKLVIEPYQSQQLLVWVDTKQTATHPGHYKASLEYSVEGQSGAAHTIPIALEVAAVRLAATTPLNVHNWSYFYSSGTPVTKGLEKEALANLRDYGVNAWSQDWTQVPIPTLDANGQYAGLSNAAEIYRRNLELIKGHSEEDHIVWLGFQRPGLREMLLKPGVLEGYLKDIHAILDEYKIPLDRRYIQFWDEPRLPEMRESIEWMQKIHVLDPTFKFYENGSAIPPGKEEFAEFIKLVDRWMPNWDQVFLTQPAATQKLLSAKIRHLGFYRCLMSRNNRGVNIYEYYRLMPWHLMEYGMDTLGFWVYNVGQENPWDGTTGSSSGGMVVYSKDGRLLTSRRWELFREGIEDYKLAQLAVGTTGPIQPEKYPQLQQICKDVIAHPLDAAYADAVRDKLITLALQQKRDASNRTRN